MAGRCNLLQTQTQSPAALLCISVLFAFVQRGGANVMIFVSDQYFYVSQTTIRNPEDGVDKNFAFGMQTYNSGVF